MERFRLEIKWGLVFGIPAAAFFTADLDGEYARLKGRGVAFKGEPRNMGPVSSVLFDDTCGNWINLVQPA